VQIGRGLQPGLLFSRRLQTSTTVGAAAKRHKPAPPRLGALLRLPRHGHSRLARWCEGLTSTRTKELTLAGSRAAH